ncbi:MAG: hypothetical protein A2381_10880 [Bdellovibrionales bacterium RIFOXYB1_FULL_37_110]|nr:MAG: hypothetical protein A2181_07020 [Bdellovibrionales bacterium RIFOXYA1_FULL_38_20]OFZ51168.1 MAG: hypothetical protein A2417_17865 [Bdellovibrionales bacterium RIFOXYC1_FULL_37_79]OFZ61274.1 MAG: hypothetical protein A2381_10880 [Bdellovibrionales bacterium RIFOXYB1_FULL_37_110]OFZ62137.1 MAG: hypothetical protein A2577_14455 [Bdellovibrionales bacterium RIFOXYD1_FULL_36_51]OFZ67043.1 MAG: hypothetical protein A2328_06460 [Bdellovibrionales bacterium RIFOXYB2_FULL_36_6]
MDLLSLKKTVSRLKTQLFKNSNSFSIGMLKSHFKGSGLQFKEHRVYCPGDDVRFIDWKIIAKNNGAYIKTFDEERNVEIVVILDASTTMFSGINNISKLQVGIEICSLLYLLAKETNDQVHAIIISDSIISLPKLSGEEGVVALVSTLQKNNILKENGQVNIHYNHMRDVTFREKASVLMKYLYKKKEVVILSDFNDFFDEETLKRIVSKRNIHCFQLVSPLDSAKKLPYLLHCSERTTKKARSGVVHFYDKDELKGSLGKKIKKLLISERYLEDFVKEML